MSNPPRVPGERNEPSLADVWEHAKARRLRRLRAQAWARLARTPIPWRIALGLTREQAAAHEAECRRKT